jgi:uncharacterized protein (DUF488 family)
MTVKRLVTIGYEGAAIADFLVTITAAGVTTLLDVRQFASSRRKDFSKTQLRENLGTVGIHYLHKPALGSPRDIRHRLRRDGDDALFFLAFNRYLATQHCLLEQLAVELSGTVALMCYERDYQQCHRRSVADALGRLMGLQPLHLTVQPETEALSVA